MSKSQRKSKSPEQVESQRLIDQALDQLDQEMSFMYAQNSALVTQWMTHEMTAGEKTFAEAAVHLARNFLIPGNVLALRAVGERIDREMDEHTVSGDI